MNDGLNLGRAQGAQHLQQQNDRLQLLLKLTNSIISNLELKDVLRAIAANVREVMHCDAASISLPGPEPGSFRVYAVDFPDSKGFVKEEQIITPGEASPAKRAFDTLKPIIANPRGASDGYGSKMAAVEGIKTVCFIPLVNRGRALGNLGLARATDNPFTEEDVEFLSQAAGQIAIAIENALLFEDSLEKARMERDLIMAQEIQRNFLPKVDPVFEPYDISGNARPCTPIGGDYFDFIPIDQSRLGLVIADVSGHGVSAALLMASLRSSLHALIPAMQDLALLAAQLNDAVHRDSESRSFISFFFGVLDRNKGEVSFINAGHNPPLLVEPGGGIRFLNSTGFCLGMFPGIRYETMTVKMRPDEILCLYTDGITESWNMKQEQFTVGGLVQQLRESVDLPARDTIQRVYERVSRHTEFAAPRDDMTIVVVKTQARGPEHETIFESAGI